MAPKPAALPDDVLVEILRRLAPLLLAASRRVCRAWRDTVDARLRRNLLSHSVRGLFINYISHGFSECFLNEGFSEFFSRPSTGPAICGGLDFLPTGGVKVADHCQGLLLCGDVDGEREYVVNPATRRWARLPRRPAPQMPGFGQSAYLAFDAAASPHYEVFLIPRLPAASESDDDDDAFLASEWPPASYVLHVFSSMDDDRWEERTFLREGDAAGIVADMGSDRLSDRYHAVYWRSALYIHCQHGYLTRMCLPNHTYGVIRLPGELIGYPNHYLGRSLSGVYCAQNYGWRLQIWHLNESHDQTEWVLKHDIDLTIFSRKFQARACDYDLHKRGPWILQNVNYRKISEKDGRVKNKALVEEKYDWNSDEDNVLDIEDDAEGFYDGYYRILGFHPYKEIVYLDLSPGRGLAYDWNSSKFQDLGSLYPDGHYEDEEWIFASFPYTPCWMGEFPGNELETLLEYEYLFRSKLELEAQLEYESNFTDEYELRKLCGRAKRLKDSRAKIRRKDRIRAR